METIIQQIRHTKITVNLKNFKLQSKLILCLDENRIMMQQTYNTVHPLHRRFLVYGEVAVCIL